MTYEWLKLTELVRKISDQKARQADAEKARKQTDKPSDKSRLVETPAKPHTFSF